METTAVIIIPIMPTTVPAADPAEEACKQDTADINISALVSFGLYCYSCIFIIVEKIVPFLQILNTK